MPGGDEAVVLGAALGLGVVVDAVGVGQQAETAHAPGVRRGMRTAIRRTSTASRRRDRTARCPCARRGAGRSPGRGRARRRASTRRCRRRRRSGPGRAGGWRGRPRRRRRPGRDGTARRARRRTVRGEAAVEAHDVVVGVAGGGRQEAHARTRGGGEEREDVVVEQRGVFLHREPAAAEGHDLRGAAGGSSGGRIASARWLAFVDGSAYPILVDSLSVLARGRYGPASEIRMRARWTCAHKGRSANN